MWPQCVAVCCSLHRPPLLGCQIGGGPWQSRPDSCHISPGSRDIDTTMGKLFLKLWVLILLTSLTSFKIQQAVFDHVYAENMQSLSNERVRRTYAYIEEALRPYPKSEWPRRFDEMKSRVGSPKEFMGPSRLMRVDELSSDPRMDAEALARINSAQTYARPLANSGGGTEMFHTVLDGDFVVVVEIPVWK